MIFIIIFVKKYKMMKTIKYDIDSWFDDCDDGISIPEFTTKKKLKNFCKEYTIDKDIFEEM